MQLTEKQIIYIVYMEQVSMLLDRRLGSRKVRWREKDWTGYGRGPSSILRLLVPHLGARRRRKRRRWKEAVGRKEGYTKYGGKRDDGATRIEKEMVAGGKRGDGEKRSAQSGWDEKFSLASLRCLYTRGSCMAMGHISVSRERGAPPKNQIECKNRINSSCKLESYVRPVGSLSKLSLFPLLFSLFPSLSFSLPRSLFLLFFTHSLP